MMANINGQSVKTNRVDVLDKGYVRLEAITGSDLSTVNSAKVSYDKKSTEFTDKEKRLIIFLAKHGHTSPFRHAFATFEVYAPLMIARQWYKYQIGSAHEEIEPSNDPFFAWNESCLPINETVKSWYGKEYTIERLLELKEKNKLPIIRSVDNRGEIVKGKIKDIWEVGIADVFEVESELGFKVKTTSNHRYLTPSGYKTLEQLKVGDEVMMNGVPAYKDRSWLEKQYVENNRTQKEIALLAGCSVHTIRKWVKIYGLQQDQVQRMLEYNKKNGVFGKGLTKETSEIILNRAVKAGKAQQGTTKKRNLKEPTIDNTGHWQARKLYKKEVCRFCLEENSLEIHHIDKNPKNNSIENVEILCKKHHDMRHGKAVLMVAHPVKIKSIKHVSKETVYDIEVEEFQNFVSNQFILHNSRRYITEEPEFYVVQPDEWRSAPANSKQGSGEIVNKTLGKYATKELLRLHEEGLNAYEEAMSQGICAEQARLFLPAYGLYVRWYWSASIQGVAHMLNQRLAHDSQKEFQLYAKAVYDVMVEHFPVSIDELVKMANEAEGNL